MIIRKRRTESLLHYLVFPFNSLNSTSKVVALILVVLFVGCSGGGVGGSGTSSGPGSTFLDLNNATIVYDHAPANGDQIGIRLESAGNIGEVEWSLQEEPTGSSLALNVSADTLTVSLTPTVAGKHTLHVSSVNNNSERTTSFTIREYLSFDPLKVRGYDGTGDIQNHADIIDNQAWVSSFSLTRGELTTVVSNYPLLNIVGYDDTLGLLVEFDDQNTATQTALANLKQETGVDDVFNRIFRGSNIDRRMDHIPAPCEIPIGPCDPAQFGTGDAWHLGEINILGAWHELDSTQNITGGNDFYIGIVDGGITYNHEDIEQSRFAEQISSSTTSAHGTQVAGSIIAEVNNRKGITGINKSTDIYASNFAGKDLCYLRSALIFKGSEEMCAVKYLLDKDADIPLINSSWTLTGKAPQPYQPLVLAPLDEVYVPGDPDPRFDYAVRTSRDFRTLATVNRDRLFIWSAGNGVDYDNAYTYKQGNSCIDINGNTVPVPDGIDLNGDGSSDVVYDSDGNGCPDSIDKKRPGIYGIDAKYGQGAIHYSQLIFGNKQLSKLDNVITVAALRKLTGIDDLYLAPYSDYGESVDIAAPTEYLSTGGKDRDGEEIFPGSSAAAPVVTGVASLVYSVDSSFAPREVKEILIGSALNGHNRANPITLTDTTIVTHRLTRERRSLDDIPIEILAHKLPVVNAKRAVEMAKCIKVNRDLGIQSVPAIVPDLVEENENTARNYIITSDLLVGSVASIPHPTIPVGSIVKQSLLARSETTRCNFVALEVSSGPQFAYANSYTNILYKTHLSPGNIGDTSTYDGNGGSHILSDYDQEIGTIRVPNGNGGHTIVNITDIAIDSSGQMYGTGYYNDPLYEIDKTTGIAQIIDSDGVPEFPAGDNPIALAFDQNDTLYTVAGHSLYTINTSTGNAALVPGDQSELASLYIQDIAFSSNGVLYGLADIGGTYTLIKIEYGADPLTYTPVGNGIGDPNTIWIRGLVFTDDRLYGVGSYVPVGTSTSVNALFEIDTLTGEVDYIRNVGMTFTGAS